MWQQVCLTYWYSASWKLACNFYANNKLLAFRTQDQVDIENLVAAHRDTLDLDWIRAEWQTVTSLDDPRMRRLLEWVSEQP